MIISDRFVFLHLQKCAGAFVKSLLEQMFSDARKKGTPHDSVADIEPQDRHKTIFGTVRNPWDWYVSYYSYTKSKAGWRTLHAGGTFDYWLGELFRAGLHGAEPKKLGGKGVGHPRRVALSTARDGRIDTSLMNTLGIGPYTYWFVQRYFEDSETVLQNWNVDSILSGDLGTRACNHFCRVEDLRNELLRFFDSIDLELTSEQHSLLMSFPIKNNTNPGNRVTETFYDEEKSALIREKEELLVRMFGYEEPWNA